MRIIRQFDDFLAKIEGWVLIFLLGVMVLLSFSQVLLRNLFHEGILWADIFLRQLVLWVGFLGASLAVRERKHIAVDILPHFLKETGAKLLRIAVDIAAGVISLFLTHAAWAFMQFEREGESTLFLDIPVWLFQTILPFSFLMIALRFFLQALTGITHFRTPKE